MSKKCRILVYTITMLIVSLCLFVIFSFLHKYGVFKPRFTLIGEEKITLSLQESYQEYGYEVFYRFKSYHEEVKITENIDVSKVGEYVVTYYVPSLDIRKKRIVEVKDVKPPILKIKGEQTIYTFLHHPYVEEGAQAYDEYDGDVSDKISVDSSVDVKKEGTYEIVYSVSDESGNTSKVKRNVVVCKDPTNTYLSYQYDHLDNKAFQWWFKKSKDHIRNEGALNSTILKKYQAYYVGEEEKVIYLTFDEGGSEKTYCEEIADLLNRYEIQGTFFFTKNYILNNADFIRSLSAQGHVVGNHTHNHLNMTTIANPEQVKKFCKEITSVEKAYMQVTGKEMVKVFRFPKGECSERTMQMVADLGYKTFFWSHAYYDYGETLSYEEAYKNMIEYYHKGAIYLIHPNNKGNYEALEDFIKEMLELGYHFKTVDQIS